MNVFLNLPKSGVGLLGSGTEVYSAPLHLCKLGVDRWHGKLNGIWGNSRLRCL